MSQFQIFSFISSTKEILYDDEHSEENESETEGKQHNKIKKEKEERPQQKA